MIDPLMILSQFICFDLSMFKLCSHNLNMSSTIFGYLCGSGCDSL